MTNVLNFYCAGTSLTEDHHHGLVPKLYKSTTGQKHFLNGVGSKPKGSNSRLTPGRTNAFVDPKLNVTYKAKPNRKKRPLYPGFFFQIKSVFSGRGVDSNVSEIIQCIKQVIKANPPGEIVINLTGFSQGAITCLLAANALETALNKLKNSGEKITDKVSINILAIDPVPSPGLRERLKTILIPKMTNDCLLLYGTRDKRPGFEPIPPENLIAKSESTNIIPITFPCLHTDLTDPRGEAKRIKKLEEREAISAIKKLTKYIALSFLSKHGVKFITNKNSEGIQIEKEGIENFQGKTAYQEALIAMYDKLYKFSSILKERKNPFIKKVIGGGRKASTRSALTNNLQRKKPSRFINHHHLALTNTLVPPTPPTPEQSTRTPGISELNKKKQQPYKHHPSKMREKLEKAGLLGHKQLNNIFMHTKIKTAVSTSTSTSTSQENRSVRISV